MDQIQPNLLRLVYHMVPPKALGDEGSAQALRPAQAPRPAQAAPRRPPRPIPQARRPDPAKSSLLSLPHGAA
ncbi:hypothetical protein Pyn_02308 [Prunus yedoensis var. nudiflora]|uniref:Uncharacterized protein n=1 Tax=Prunus yedoensis var. nudiflora TaxID=2094558 RepID=A0A314UJD5_PRUYE|nr:hypothetical protein Pyn_02308 [Prunus yedoensis var. nudiflora]